MEEERKHRRRGEGDRRREEGGEEESSSEGGEGLEEVCAYMRAGPGLSPERPPPGSGKMGSGEVGRSLGVGSSAVREGVGENM